ncbi:hypothetical protein PIB30_088961 [Stylosanthes scabra]|uniref:Uncharacterized protein n=1 Tax=Stylosanthes scabra TaxID=79078 RepID=A0ABU6YUE9_9FABA|nr:hypothetical protein [Stylosanthes scabra]
MSTVSPMETAKEIEMNQGFFEFGKNHRPINADLKLVHDEAKIVHDYTCNVEPHAIENERKVVNRRGKAKVDQTNSSNKENGPIASSLILGPKNRARHGSTIHGSKTRLDSKSSNSSSKLVSHQKNVTLAPINKHKRQRPSSLECSPSSPILVPSSSANGEPKVSTVPSCPTSSALAISEVYLGDSKWLCSAVYGSPNLIYRRFLWDHLLSLASDHHVPRVLLEDFNEILTQDEVRGGTFIALNLKPLLIHSMLVAFWIYTVLAEALPGIEESKVVVTLLRSLIEESAMFFGLIYSLKLIWKFYAECNLITPHSS